VAEHEERVQPVREPVGVAPQPGPVGAAAVQLRDPGAAALGELVERSEGDRPGGARTDARRLLVDLEAVVAERALVGAVVDVGAGDHPERAGADAVAAAVADVVLHEHGAELGAHDGAGRADVHAAGVLAVLADVGDEEPSVLAVRAIELLEELDVPPGVPTEVAGVVVADPQPAGAVGGQAVPLLAGHLARLAADAERRVGEEADGGARGTRLGAGPGVHRVRLPVRTAHISALVSLIETFGSSVSESRSLTTSPVTSPL